MSSPMSVLWGECVRACVRECACVCACVQHTLMHAYIHTPERVYIHIIYKSLRLLLCWSTEESLDKKSLFLLILLLLLSLEPIVPFLD